jgi:hypothetical protein
LLKTAQVGFISNISSSLHSNGDGNRHEGYFCQSKKIKSLLFTNHHPLGREKITSEQSQHQIKPKTYSHHGDIVIVLFLDPQDLRARGEGRGGITQSHKRWKKSKIRESIPEKVLLHFDRLGNHSQLFVYQSPL